MKSLKPQKINNNFIYNYYRHVLLGFTKSGEYLMSYCQKIESDNAFGFSSYTYTLHWWRFNLMKPLHEVANY